MGDLIDFEERRGRGRRLLVGKDAPWPACESLQTSRLASLGADTFLVDAILGLSPQKPENVSEEEEEDKEELSLQAGSITLVDGPDLLYSMPSSSQDTIDLLDLQANEATSDSLFANPDRLEVETGMGRSTLLDLEEPNLVCIEGSSEEADAVDCPSEEVTQRDTVETLFCPSVEEDPIEIEDILNHSYVQDVVSSDPALNETLDTTLESYIDDVFSEALTSSPQPSTLAENVVVTGAMDTSWRLGPSAPSLEDMEPWAVPGPSAPPAEDVIDEPKCTTPMPTPPPSRPPSPPLPLNLPPPPPPTPPPIPTPPVPPRPPSPDEDMEPPTWRYTMATAGGGGGGSNSGGTNTSPGIAGQAAGLGQWPHSLSPALACLATALGFFNISRFAILSVHYGANFLLQWLVMSLVVGIPLLTYHLSLGQILGSGSIDMWSISPIMQGIGIAIMVGQTMIGVYSVVGVSWLFVYFRDSFIARNDIYRWAQPSDPSNIGSLLGSNGSSKLEETVGEYFSAVVLQRSESSISLPFSTAPAQLKFQLVCNLAIVWSIVFLALSKGIKSYGKVVLVLSLAPIFGMAILCSKLFGITPPGATVIGPLGTIDWTDFFLNTRSWSAALVEAFMTWGLLGAAAKQIAAISSGKEKPALHRTAAAVSILTIAILALTAFLANSCVTLLATMGYSYGPSSFEKTGESFLEKVSSRHGSSYANLRWVPHAGLLLGERVGTGGHGSGYAALRLATELMPATFAAVGTHLLSPFWAVLFYLILILFGIAQQLVIMHCVISGLISINTKTLKQWETTITFFTCACGFILGLPMATEFGMYVVYFLDFSIGGAWWLAALYLAELAAVFVVRGRPYSGEAVVARLFIRATKPLKLWMAPLLSFVWNVILPVIMTILCMSMFRGGSWREVGGGRRGWAAGGGYWPGWSRHVAMAIQLVPLVAIPLLTAIIQTIRYLSRGPPDIFDRLQMLYRPVIGGGSIASMCGTDLVTSEVSSNQPPPPPPSTPPLEDPPPKYTPPPSYTTATGARIAKLLRQSFRRSMRRLRAVAGTNSASDDAPAVPPPPYTTVLVELGGPAATSVTATSVPTLSSMLRNSFRCAMQRPVTSSQQRLVDAAAPINHDSFVLPGDPIESVTPESKPHTHIS